MSETVNFERFDTTLGIEYSTFASERYGSDLWVVKKDFIYYVDDTRMSTIKVPRGYLTDGATVPRVFWNLVPPWGKYGQACVLHDYLCEYPFYDNGENRITVDRKEVDSILSESMEVLNVPKSTRKLMMGGVNLYRTVSRTRDSTYCRTKADLERELKGHYLIHGVWK